MKRLILLIVSVMLITLGYSQTITRKGIKVGDVKPGTSIITVDSITQRGTGEIIFWKGSQQMNPNLLSGFKIGNTEITTSAFQLNFLSTATDTIQKQIDNKVNLGDSISPLTYFYSKEQIDSMKLTPNVTPYSGGIVETKSRISNQTEIWGGTKRDVGLTGHTYTTLTDAMTAASDGDSIVIYPGTYDLSSESGGYLMLNVAAKGLIFVGSTGNPEDVILNHTSATYAVRVRDIDRVQFQDLTINSSGNYGIFTMDQAYSSNWFKCKNVVLNKTSTTSFGIFGRTSLTSDTDIIWIEFDNCKLLTTGTLRPIVYTASGVNETILFTGCTIQGSALATGQPLIMYTSGHKGNIVMYDNILINSSNTAVVQFGEDESVPTNTTFTVDFRNNKIICPTGYANHALLLGRGTNKVYCVNNTITMDASSNSLAAGIVIKTTATAVNNSYIAGNYANTPRPCIMKGGQNNIIKFNTFVTNYPASFYGMDIQNPEATRISTGNVVKFNNFFGGLSAIGIYPSVGYESPSITIKGWDINANRYWSTNNKWLLIGSTEKLFSDRRQVYGNKNDCYSHMVSNGTVNIADYLQQDNTSTISW